MLTLIAGSLEEHMHNQARRKGCARCKGGWLMGWNYPTNKQMSLHSYIHIYIYTHVRLLDFN